ncbi:MAG: extracellular solute-binding protein [Hyphomicrobiaceae bacterium]
MGYQHLVIAWRRRLAWQAAGALVLAALLQPAAGMTGATAAEPVSGIAIQGEPKFAPGFTHFNSVNPKAPQAGRLVQGVLGSFDTTNPFIIKGVPVAGVRDYVTESLLARGIDEPFSLYGLIAESVELPDDRSEVTFNLNPKARFSDGRPVTATDVLFSFENLRDKGRPNHRAYFKKVVKTERLGDLKVRFVFDNGGDRELPLILGVMPIFASHVLTSETFEQTSLSPFIGSGPYTMAVIDPGRSITYKRNPDYWGRDLPVNRGRFNFDEMRYEYFRDDNVMFEAFKNGELDVRFEDNPALWSQGYDIPAVREGRIIKAEIAAQQPAGMHALVFNTRRPLFANRAVRQALIQLFDFEYVNRSLFNGLYKRTESFFERSMLSSAGRAADEEEKRLLTPFTTAVDPNVMAGKSRLPTTDGTGRNRANLAKALQILSDAGYKAVNGQMVDPAGKPLAFEMLVNSAQQRLLSGFAADLARIGIAMSIRQVDQAQYQARLRTYDYDMIQYSWPSSLSPGNEQLFRWSGPIGRQDGSFNFAGVDNPAADAMIGAMLAARSPEAFQSAVRALDRVLLSGDYVIPLYHVPRYWIAHSSRIKYPAQSPMVGLLLDTWWTQKK